MESACLTASCVDKRRPERLPIFEEDPVATREDVDVVIVGGGPAGAVLANRLSDDPGRRVLLIEAGPDYGSDRAGWPAELLFSEQQALRSHSWDLRDAGSGIDLPRARVIGGSSAVNACYWVRGSAVDFDEWRDLGNPGWGFDDLLPYFRRAETDPLGGPLHGTDGPVTVWRVQDWSAGDLAVMEAAIALGLERVDDINGARGQVPSAGPAPKNLVGHDRLNSALSYLRPVRHRPNLRVMAETTVDRVRFEGTRAAGVVTTTGVRIDADLVVLAAGAYFTPGILNRSGYGDSSELRRLGIPVTHHLPGVGKNLLDHPFAIGVIDGRIRPDAVFGVKLQGQAMVRSRSQGSVEIDCHIYDAQYFDEEIGDWVISLSVSMVNARSTGTVSLTSADPTATPRIEHRHFSDPADLERLCDGVEFATELFRTAPLADLSETLDARTWVNGDREALRGLVRSKAATTNHCSGTAKMGPDTDPSAVVDPGGHVYGAEGLVIADSSIFPTCPRGNIHFPVVAVAEKIAAGLA